VSKPITIVEGRYLIFCRKKGRQESVRKSVTRIRRMSDEIREDLVHKSYVKKMLGANPTWYASKNVMYGSRE